MNVTGFASWPIFGILKNEWSLIITNVLILARLAFLLVMTLFHRDKKDAVANARRYFIRYRAFDRLV
nr:hypothetical protein [Mesorhizobium atlanticum]